MKTENLTIKKVDKKVAQRFRKMSKLRRIEQGAMFELLVDRK